MSQGRPLQNRLEGFLFGFAGGVAGGLAVAALDGPLAATMGGKLLTASAAKRVLQYGVFSAVQIGLFQEGLHQCRVRGWSSDKFDPGKYQGAAISGLAAYGVCLATGVAPAVHMLTGAKLAAVTSLTMLPCYTHVVATGRGLIGGNRDDKYPLHVAGFTVSCLLGGYARAMFWSSMVGGTVGLTPSIFLMCVIHQAAFHLAAFGTIEALEKNFQRR